MKDSEFVKYFHELTREEYSKLVKTGMTYGELGKKYPQPKWCWYPDATQGMIGCWSLVGFAVTGEDFCKKCDCYKKPCIA